MGKWGLPEESKLFRPVPLLDLRPQFSAIESEVLSVIQRVVSSQKFILGEEVEAFETGDGGILQIQLRGRVRFRLRCPSVGIDGSRHRSR